MRPERPRDLVAERRARAALAVVLLIGLLAVVAVASRERAPRSSGDSSEGGLPPLFLDSVASLAVLLVPAGLLLVIAVGLVNRRGAAGRKSQARSAVMVILFVAGASLAAVAAAELFRNRADGPGARIRVTSIPDAGRRRAGDLEPYRPQFRWVPFIVAGTVLAGGGIVMLIRRARRSGDDQIDAAQALSELLDETIDDLWNEPSARRAVIAAYARMERSLAAHGFPRSPFEAPLEYLRRILLDLEVRPGSVFDLTELFERAKFSSHRIDGSMKEEALIALVAVRDDLRAAIA